MGAGSVLRGHHRADTATDIEVAHDAHELRRTGRHQVVQDPVDHVLVIGALFTEGPEIELERQELDAPRSGDVTDPDGGEVRLSGLGADAGELRTLHGHLVVPVLPWIGDGFDLLAGLRRHSSVLSSAFHPVCRGTRHLKRRRRGNLDLTPSGRQTDAA